MQLCIYFLRLIHQEAPVVLDEIFHAPRLGLQNHTLRAYELPLMTAGDLVRESTSLRFRMLAAELGQPYLGHCYVQALTLERPRGNRDEHGLTVLLLSSTHLSLFNASNLTLLWHLPLNGLTSITQGTSFAINSLLNTLCFQISLRSFLFADAEKRMQAMLFTCQTA